MRKKNKEQLSLLISKAIQKNICDVHSKPVTQICLKTFKLGCSKCSISNSRSIKDVLSNPIEAPICFFSSITQATQICKGIKLVSEHLQVKTGLQTFVNLIKSTVNQFCDQILEKYNQKWNQAFQDCANAYSQIKCAEQRYKSVFQQLIQNKFVNGTVQQLEDCFSQFCSYASEDPSCFIQQRVSSIMQCEKNLPQINWQNFKQLYLKISDPQIWSPQHFLLELPKLEKRSSSLTLIPQIKNTLQKKGFKLKFNKQSVTLYYQNQEIEQIKQINNLFEENDAYYEINKCRVIGVNYSGLTLYRYGCGKLEKIKFFPVSGCSNLLDFDNCLILEAEGRIVRLWIDDGKRQIVGLSGSNLQFTNNKFQFQFLNSKEETVTRFAFHNQF